MTPDGAAVDAVAGPAGEVGVVRPRPLPGAALRLICFPYAGGGASVFASWPAGTGPDIEVCAVQLPGREARLGQPPFRDVRTLVSAVEAGVGSLLDEPFALFGHSMGALVAYEFARRLAARGRPAPAHVFVSARPGPHLPRPWPGAHLLPDDKFIDRIREMGGTPAQVLGDARLMRLVLPVLRADFAVNDEYVHRPGPLLSCPVTALGGLDDPQAPPSALTAWQRHTSGPFRLRLFSGGHFYLREHRDELLRVVRESLTGR
ncbi:thioesterase II family protein [Micromonospora sp. NPDC051227]|uniref:thioesterase II family protein n=1 Tax=Micromonospora sp. NPDC051227 TaxID=3364285 RepID=UPI0037AF6E0F